MHDRDPAERRVVTPGFHARVYAVVREVPRGLVTTYGDVATMLGSPRVARHVGWALAALGPDDADVPWHRVINSRGHLSYRGDDVRAVQQTTMLAAEGVHLDDSGRVIDFARLRYAFPDHDPA
ncbi:MAG: cysteine methyltransferase [Deltaproteobacteria bacterium]|nr:MAG: cysteine methyltransferase [Deltaproteobacteria bacterium]